MRQAIFNINSTLITWWGLIRIVQTIVHSAFYSMQHVLTIKIMLAAALKMLSLLSSTLKRENKSCKLSFQVYLCSLKCKKKRVVAIVSALFLLTVWMRSNRVILWLEISYCAVWQWRRPILRNCIRRMSWWPSLGQLVKIVTNFILTGWFICATLGLIIC